uniref:Uncharacterized protein n=1 Tax=Nelumbo nucifera TaxID=4432 RepID=A0A822ZE23_NELNU|nr:TPA_asm: hypothetical protein HUJ06_014172 [Nelumbo nucifera]
MLISESCQLPEKELRDFKLRGEFELPKDLQQIIRDLIRSNKASDLFQIRHLEFGKQSEKTPNERSQY